MSLAQLVSNCLKGVCVARSHHQNVLTLGQDADAVVILVVHWQTFVGRCVKPVDRLTSHAPNRNNSPRAAAIRYKLLRIIDNLFNLHKHEFLFRLLENLPIFRQTVLLHKQHMVGCTPCCQDSAQTALPTPVVELSSLSTTHAAD